MAKIMKTHELPEVPAHSVERWDRLRCDLCGSKSHHREDWVRYDIAEVTVRLEEGARHPEDGRGTYGTCTIVDLCPGCFKNRLLPWLRSQGAESRVEEWDY
jgi:hypothetical protein